MTENQWPQAFPSTSLDEYGNPVPATPAGTTSYGTTSPVTTPSGTTPYGTPSPGTQGASDSKTDAAKTEATEVAGQAVGAAKDVAETAKAEAANVASEVKTNARDLLHQAKSDLTSQAGTQQQKVASGLRSVSEELHAMARTSDQPGLASDLVRQVADRSQSVASWLDARDPGSLLNEVQTFARRRPGTFLLLAAGAGILAGRLTKGLAAGPPETAGTPDAQVPSGQAHSPAAYPPAAYPPAPSTAPAQQGGAIRQETVFAAGDDRGLFDEPAIATGGPVSAQTLPTGAPGDIPLREDDDPFRGTASRDAEGRHL